MRDAIDAFCAAFDHIIIDAPAAFEGPDVSLVADAVDAFLLVARKGRSRARFINKALEQTDRERVAGVVFLGG